MLSPVKVIISLSLLPVVIAEGILYSVVASFPTVIETATVVGKVDSPTRIIVLEIVPSVRAGHYIGLIEVTPPTSIASSKIIISTSP